MNEMLIHRGPDEGSVDVFGICALGHRRLRVVDLETGSQPAANEVGDVICVFNGELYEFGALRQELAAAGHAVPGTGDTSVIPHLYEEYGVGFVARLHGMFAIALWDVRRRRLVLARDRIGKKPLLWTQLPDGGIAFASELKALLRLPDVRRDIDLAAVDAYLALRYVPGSQTPLHDVHKLAPGHLLVWEGGRIQVQRWWQLEPEPASLSDEDWLERVREEVRAAVRRRLVADVPLGALLSGGIDSSIVVGLMAEASSEPVRTFTVGFPDKRYDERGPARAVARRFGTRHEELGVDLSADFLPDLAQAYDEPLGDEAALPLYLICKLTRQHVTVALSGDGGDEAFAGYERYAALGLANRAARVRGVAGGGARALRAFPSARREPRSTLFRAARLLDVASRPAPLRYGALLEVFQPELRARLWTEEALAAIGRPMHAIELIGRPPAEGVVGLQRLDAETYLPNDLLLKADIASMAHSLELRSPFLDHKVLELGISLPDSLRIDGRRGKVALRRAFSSLLPPQTTARGKTGFGVPLGRWFRNELREFAGDLLLGRPACDRGLFRPDVIGTLLAEHVSGRRDHGKRLWCLLMLELWQRTHIEPVTVPFAVPSTTQATLIAENGIS